MIQFYAPDIASTLTLPESDSRHAVKVLRMTEGDTLQAIDGCGLLYTCRLVEAHPKRAAVEIIESRLQPLPWAQQLTVAVAPTKHMDRMEWMVEKMTEIGVNRIIPLLCDLMPEAQRFVGYCDPSVPRRELSHIYSPHKDTMILIGPEGDFTPAEVSLMLEAGIVPATFGDNRLRTETAALYALSACHVIDSSHSPEH